jgi:hypothetical protein
MRRFLVFVLLFFVLTLHMSLFGQIGILEDHFIKSFQKFSAEMKRIATHEQYTLFQYRTFYPSMAFYQKKFSVLVNFEKDIRFDPPEVKNRLLPDVDAIFTEQSRFSAPHFVLLPQDCLSDFAKYSVEVLLRKQKMLLLKLPAVEQSTATN